MSNLSIPNSTIRESIFVSYSHADRKWLNEVQRTLTILRHYDNLLIWDDTKIKTGSNWKEEIKQSIDKSKIAILLISSNFLSSDFILKSELPNILKIAKRKGLIIFNVIIDICAFKLTELDQFQCLNDPNNPLTFLKPKERQQVLVKLATEIKNQLVEQLPKSGKEKNLSFKDDMVFLPTLILTFLIRRGDSPITALEEFTSSKRKLIISELEKLQKLGYAEKYNGVYNKKPSSLWKASALGADMFKEFQSISSKITI